MKILLLGGTAFLGRRIAVAAMAHGHEVTCVARGSSPAPDGVDLIRADRDEDQGLAPVTETHWDAVIDVSRQPGQVRRAVRDLSCSHWVFVSSGNASADFSTLEQDEKSAVRAPLQGDALMEDMSSYGESQVARRVGDPIRRSDLDDRALRADRRTGRRDLAEAGTGRGGSRTPPATT